MCRAIAPPWRDIQVKAEVGATSTHRAVRCGGRYSAAMFWTMPPWELPVMPTRPFDHAWAAIHSMVS